MRRLLLVTLGGLLAFGGILALVVTFAWPRAEQKIGEIVLGGRVQEGAVLGVLIRENADHYAFACLDEAGTSPDAIISALQLPVRRWSAKSHKEDTPFTIFYDPDTGPTNAQVFMFDRREVAGTVCLVPTTDTRPLARS